MINKILEEYKRRRSNYYKNFFIACSSKCEMKRLFCREIDKKGYLEAISQYCDKMKCSEVYDDVVSSVSSYWKNNGIESNNNLKFSKSFKNLYLFRLAVERRLYADSHVQEIKDINLLKYLLLFLDESSNRIFTDFEGLKKVLDEMSITKNEMADLMLAIIDANNRRLKREDYLLPINKAAILESKKNGLTKSLIKDYVEFNVIDFFDDYYIVMRKRLKKRINQINTEFPVDTSFIEAKSEIVMNLMDGADILDDGVKNQLLACLDYFSCSSIYTTLASRRARAIKQQEEALRKEEKMTNQENKEVYVKEENVGLSRKEINSYSRKLNSVYDFDNNKVLKVLTMDEIISCVAIMNKINADTKTINKFLQTAEKALRQNPIMAYMEMLEKMRYTIKSDTTISFIDELETLVEEVYASSSDEEKCIQLIDEIDEYIRLINNEMGNDYTYEYDKARKILEV